ncbi:DNA polymerase III subunit delta' [Bacillus sp. FJAT-47783]|uniref:DNA polymerase III subunit delta' n=1 Tax=Bacillus sp. FJAT-47783 TaxID=2922712 RepID=UPI001FAE25FC|nr:DNA polymerase III subunit delta' [Bacillus sp. FJAT-47783]
MKTWEQLTEYQPRVLKIFQNTIQKNRLAHAYLFEGKRGTGKKDAALLLARSYFCESLRDDFKPCEQCKNCKRIQSGNHPDVHLIEPDGLSIKKWQIQALQEEFSKTGVESNRKLYIISHCDKMTANAANSLLKFLEEPTNGTMAILMTEQIQLILPTILSRCQVISFQPLSPIKIKEWLIEKGMPTHLAALASHLTNSIEEAQKLCEDNWFAEARTKVIKLYEILNSRQNKVLLYIHSQWMPFFNDKEKLESGLDLLLYLYKDFILIQASLDQDVVYQDLLTMLKQQALQMSQRAALSHVVSIMEAKRRLGANVNPQLLMEQLVLTLQEG